jgi:DNA polymerase III epsilon subunit-like protein
MQKSSKYAFIDTETTGFDSLRNQVITLACYVTDEDYQILGEYYGEFRPEGSPDIIWSREAEKVHGISYDEALKFPTILESIESYLGFIRPFSPLTFVAHNLAFDRRMLRGTFSRYDRHFELQQCFRDYDDTVKLVKNSGLVSSKSKSLGLICKELGIAHDHHDARSDAKVLIEIHKRCKLKVQDTPILDNTMEEEYVY